MGDFSRYRPSEKQLESVRFLVSYGISRHYVAPDYKLVAHNQTRVTKSPGSYVYREIIKWPRWYACGLKTTFPCDKELLPSSWFDRILEKNMFRTKHRERKRIHTARTISQVNKSTHFLIFTFTNAKNTESLSQFSSSFHSNDPDANHPTQRLCTTLLTISEKHKSKIIFIHIINYYLYSNIVIFSKPLNVVRFREDEIHS